MALDTDATCASTMNSLSVPARALTAPAPAVRLPSIGLQLNSGFGDVGLAFDEIEGGDMGVSKSQSGSWVPRKTTTQPKWRAHPPERECEQTYARWSPAIEATSSESMFRIIRATSAPSLRRSRKERTNPRCHKLWR